MFHDTVDPLRRVCRWLTAGRYLSRGDSSDCASGIPVASLVSTDCALARTVYFERRRDRVDSNPREGNAVFTIRDTFPR